MYDVQKRLAFDVEPPVARAVYALGMGADAQTLRERVAQARARDAAAAAELLADPEALRGASVRALEHPDWKVRRDALRFLDHHLDADCVGAVLERLHDEHPDVRRWAAHALGCDHCKEGPRDLGVDVVGPLVETARGDARLRVRRSAVLTLAFHASPDARIPALLRSVLARERDGKIRFHAEFGLERRGLSASD